MVPVNYIDQLLISQSHIKIFKVVNKFSQRLAIKQGRINFVSKSGTT